RAGAHHDHRLPGHGERAHRASGPGSNPGPGQPRPRLHPGRRVRRRRRTWPWSRGAASSLERVLSTRGRPRAIVVAEGIYSLDGDLASLGALIDVCERHKAILVEDDAHGSGTLGENGRGTLEHLGLEGRVPLVVTTCS